MTPHLEPLEPYVLHEHSGRWMNEKKNANNNKANDKTEVAFDEYLFSDPALLMHPPRPKP
jgi:hypothetical protein